ncbi:VOC family protein [Nigerium sp.]|uniref:VOC family protein n=1 Tax=Nigerium sp. TaxID=2042655 RepID=UPI0032215D65
MTKPQLFTCMAFADADAAIEFLTALGFAEVLVVRDPDDPATVVHAQFRWRDNGGLMFGSVRPDDELGFAQEPGLGRCNLVVASDEEVDATLARAVAAGATVVQEPHHPPHGGRSTAVRDPEGNLWNIDSYPGE